MTEANKNIRSKIDLHVKVAEKDPKSCITKVSSKFEDVSSDVDIQTVLKLISYLFTCDINAFSSELKKQNKICIVKCLLPFICITLKNNTENTRDILEKRAKDIIKCILPLFEKYILCQNQEKYSGVFEEGIDQYRIDEKNVEVDKILFTKDFIQHILKCIYMKQKNTKFMPVEGKLIEFEKEITDSLFPVDQVVEKNFNKYVQKGLLDLATFQQSTLTPFIFLRAAQSLLEASSNLSYDLTKLLEDSLLFCLLNSKSNFNTNSYSWLLKDVAADILACLVTRNYSQERRTNVINSLKKTFDDRIPSSNHYGAVVASICLGIDAIVIIIPEVLAVYFTDSYLMLSKNNSKRIWEESVWRQKVLEKLLYAYKQALNYSFQPHSEEIYGISKEEIVIKFKDYFSYFKNEFCHCCPQLMEKNENEQPAKSKFLDVLVNEEKIMELLLVDQNK